MVNSPNASKDVDTDKIVETLLWLTKNSFVKPAMLFTEEFIDECIDKGLICEEDADDLLNDDEHKDMILLAYLHHKGILSLAILKQILAGESYSNNSNPKLKKIAQDYLGIIFD